MWGIWQREKRAIVVPKVLLLTIILFGVIVLVSAENEPGTVQGSQKVEFSIFSFIRGIFQSLFSTPRAEPISNVQNERGIESISAAGVEAGDDVGETRQENIEDEESSGERSTRIEPSGEHYEVPYRRERTYKIGFPGYSFVVEDPLKGEDLNEYFKSLDLPEEKVYVVMLFEGDDGDPTYDQLNTLNRDGIKVFTENPVGDHAYFAIFPVENLETRSYDFVRWVGLIEPEWKLKKSVKEQIEALEPNSQVSVLVKFYETPFTEEQIYQLLETTGASLIKYETVEDLLMNDDEREYAKISMETQHIDSLLELSFVKDVVDYIPPSAYILYG